MDAPTSNIPSEPEAKDFAYAIVKGAVSTIPIVGGVGGEVLSLIIASPLSERQEEWFNSLAEDLVKLREQVEGFSFDNLAENEAFVTTTMQATQSALRNHQKEKIEALRNAVLNSALPNPPSDDLQAIFLSLVDGLTPWHLRVLKLFDDPPTWAEHCNRPIPDNWGMGSVDRVLFHVHPELGNEDDLYKKLIGDLASYGLAEVPLGTMMTAQGTLASRTSKLGKQFLRFIETPPEMGD